MKASRILAGAILAGGLWGGSLAAQTPPPAPAAPADAAAAVKPGFCERLEMKIDKKRRKLCATPIGQMLNSITKPFSAVTGGIIPSFCPSTPSEEDLKKPGAEGAAAQAMADAAAAKARRQAVRILGTFDCHWYPEAEMGLVAALRTDRAECVRLEAAIALNRGCCCTRAIVEALEDAVAGTDKFGPSENSPRVQQVAAMALEHCLQCPEANPPIEEVVPPPPPPPEKQTEEEEERKKPSTPTGEPAPAPRTLTPPGAQPLTPTTPNANTPTFGPVTKGSGKPSRELIEKARRTLAKYHAKGIVVNDGPVPPGQRSLAGLANYVVRGGQSTPAITQTAPPPMAAPAVARVQNTPASQPTIIPASAEANAAAKPEPIASLQLPTAALSTPAPSAYRPIPMPAPTTAPTHPQRTIDPTVLRCLETLRDAEDPEVRHASVKTLVSFNWREHPEAITGLVYAARHDKHPGMRVACIRALAAMKAGTPEVITSLKPMTQDPDVWIRQETTQALSYLQQFLPPQSASLSPPRVMNR